jgi:serine protease AprX
MRQVRFAAVVICSMSIASHASAQLLSSTLTQVVGCTLSLAGLASSSKLDTALQTWARDGGSGRVRVIVSVQSGLLDTVRTLLGTIGGTNLGTLTGINAIVAEVNASGLSALTCSTAVASISIDAVVTVTGDAAITSAFSLRSTLGLSGSTPAGSGIGVAVVDSGIANSADFGNRITAFFDVTSGIRAAPPSDAYGHGTHVAGLIASNGSLAADADYRGVGPNVRLIGMKVLDANGGGRTSDVIRAIEYAIAQRNQLGIQIVNLSLGHPIYEPADRDPLVRVVERASRSGLIVVAAAGNFGYNQATGESGHGGITSPGNAPSAITVGAVNSKNTVSRADDEVTPYSSRGPSWYDGYAKPDIVAPGHGLVSDASIGSTLYTRYPSARVGSNYLRLSGTSMATAVATGAVALILEAQRQAHPTDPSLTPNAVKAILQFSSIRMHDPFGAEYDELVQGTGSLNAAGAVAVARAINTTVPVGSYWWTTSVTPTTMIADETWVWSSHVVWGTHIVWGTSIDTKEPAWGLSTTWGGDSTWGSHIVWGTNVVWANAETWATHVVWGSTYIGASSDSEHIVWGTAEDPDTTVWGNLAEAGR